jgi:HPt (histidine-containing phosphotransfer) domain-containing protein
MSIAENSVAAAPADLHDLFQRCLGNLDLVQRVLDAFEGNFENDLDELEAALKATSLTAAAQIAHRMKGASSNVGATVLARELASMEDLARSNQVPETLVCMGRLREEWQRYRKVEKDFAGWMN